MKSGRLKTTIVTLAAVLSAMGAAADSLLITNVDIETMTSKGRLEGHDIFIEDGKITAIGRDLSVSAGRIVDGTGRRLTPGLFNAFTQMGVVEVGAIEGTRDSSVDSENFSASLRVIDAFNPYSTLIPQNRIHGVTRVVVAPSSEGSLFAGTVSVVNLSGSVTQSIEKDSVGVLVNYNEFAQHVSGGARGAALAGIRRALTDAVDYKNAREYYLLGDGRELSLSFDDLDALIPVIEREQYLFVNVHRSSDILRVLELADSFGLRLILVGVEEGWMVASEIARSGAAVIIDPTANLPMRFETLGARLENPAILHQAGVDMMFTGMGWQNTHNAFLVAQCAGIAVANGLPYEAALAAIFSTPAEVFDLDDPGQIAEGLEADLVLWTNDPLEVVKEAELVFVAGKNVPMISRATRLRDKYFSRLKAARGE
jgi:imidazolonepropionase-like amidohydrolase